VSERRYFTADLFASRKKEKSSQAHSYFHVSFMNERATAKCVALVPAPVTNVNSNLCHSIGFLLYIEVSMHLASVYSRISPLGI